MYSNLKNPTSVLGRSLISAAMLALVAVPVSAQHNYADDQGHLYDFAKVVNVTPVIETYQVNDPIEQCWDERVPVYQSTAGRGDIRRGHSSKTPEILGAIIGGVIANQVGKRGGGKARDVATVAGAVLGGSIGHDIKRNNREARYGGRSNRHQPVAYETVQRCEITERLIDKQHVVAYDVAYKYRGSVFHTQMDQRPGDKIKLKVTVNPV